MYVFVVYVCMPGMCMYVYVSIFMYTCDNPLTKGEIVPKTEWTSKEI